MEWPAGAGGQGTRAASVVVRVGLRPPPSQALRSTCTLRGLLCITSLLTHRLVFFVFMHTVSSFGICQGMSWQHLNQPWGWIIVIYISLSLSLLRCVCFVGKRCGVRVYHPIFLAVTVVWYAHCDVSGDVLAATGSAQCGWKGVLTPGGRGRARTSEPRWCNTRLRTGP